MSISASFSASVGTIQRQSYPVKERSIYESDPPVSPISEMPPSWSGTRWTRFFPELSSHFSLTSPINGYNRRESGSSISEEPPSVSNHRQSGSDSEYTTEPKTGPSSLWSDELLDDVSSCYSRRSSVTSLGSEASASAYKSADAFSIISPTKAGVFDDSASLYRSGSNMSRKSPSTVAERGDKPLPCEPPIQMAPLSIRRKKKQQPPATIREDDIEEILESATRNQGEHRPTLSQAAEELENALAGLVEHKEPMPHLDTPLQVSRGNMEMIATRPTPIPPVSPLRNNKMANASQLDEDVRHAKKPHKGRNPFSFSMPGFGKKQNNSRPHLRSLSSSNVIANLERQVALDEAVASKEAAEKENNGPVGSSSSSGFLSPPVSAQRPASVSSERELRLKLPRLQTKDVQPPGKQSTKPLEIAPADEERQELLQPRPKPRKTFSFEPEGTMSEMASKPAVTMSEAVGPYCELNVDSGLTVVYELDGSIPGQQVKSPITVPPPFVPSGEMPRTLPDDIVYLILQQCSSLQDLFNFAVMNRQFYRVFKTHELSLIRGTVFAMSPPAWELREMSPPWECEWQVLFDLDAPVPEYTASLYLDRYTRDLYSLVKLKSLILARCGTFLRPETVRGLAGNDDARATEIDDAFWRIWSFCRIFGCGKGREGDIVGQLDWLNGGVIAKNQHCSVAMSITEPFGMHNVLFEPPEGFGRGNNGGLSQSQLYDMTEIWTCLGVLLQPIHGKCYEARKTGVFDGHDVPERDPVKEEAILEEWTYYILTLGPSAVLALGSIANVDNTDEIFQRAQLMGLTKWEQADASRSFFFREAVSKAYKPRESSPRRRSSPLAQPDANSARSSSNGSPANDIIGNNPTRRRQAAYAAQLRNRRIKNQTEVAYAEERPISSYAEIMNRLSGAPPQPQYRPPPPPLPSSIPPSLSIRPPPSNPQPPPPPATHDVQIPLSQPPRSSIASMPPQIRDPVDQAIDMMVRELGFNEEDAKWALKITDTGEGINPNAAVSLLIQEYERQNPERRDSGYSVPVRPQRNSLLSSVIHSRESLSSGWRWA
ncbi:uncharacterized protein BJX67DRAFT_160053 [Aspergillus lucknowensis]|uniref:F-box domain protein n=1 Tax=Aspergillus lucknowensis TaxID=176173 RepID=A0ABR4M450_9EURO